VVETVGFLTRLVVNALFELLLIESARLLLPALSFGRRRIVPFRQLQGLHPGPLYKRRADGTLMIQSSAVAVLMGLAIWVLGGLILLAAFA
jgi:hypothetical protein